MQHYAGQYYHVYNRGTNRQPIFANEENYYFLLRRVRQFLPLYSIRIIAYVLMPNHYHFLIGVDKDGDLSPFFQRLFNSYSQAFNRQQNRTGTLFEGRAKSIHIDETEYVYALVRYVHLNPVVAGLVTLPEMWEFSDYRDWIDLRHNGLFDPDFRSVFFHHRKNTRILFLAIFPMHSKESLQNIVLIEKALRRLGRQNQSLR